jgi:hypothetical protein
MDPRYNPDNPPATAPLHAHRIAWDNFTWRVLATGGSTIAIPSRLIGVDRLTGIILEQRVALEACNERA